MKFQSRDSRRTCLHMFLHLKVKSIRSNKWSIIMRVPCNASIRSSMPVALPRKQRRINNPACTRLLMTFHDIQFYFSSLTERVSECIVSHMLGYYLLHSADNWQGQTFTLSYQCGIDDTRDTKSAVAYVARKQISNRLSIQQKISLVWTSNYIIHKNWLYSNNITILSLREV